MFYREVPFTLVVVSSSTSRFGNMTAQNSKNPTCFVSKQAALHPEFPLVNGSKDRQLLDLENLHGKDKRIQFFPQY